MRSRTLTFADAVRLLGGADEPSVRWLERLTGVAAAGATVATLGGLDLFALRDEVVRWGHAVVGGLRERLAGLHRFDRTQRLVAAHSVIVVVAFYEALDAVLADHPHVAAQLTAAEQVSLATGGAAQEAYIEVLQQLVDTPPPMPAPHRPFEAVVDALREHYETVADRLVEFLFLLPRNSRRGPTMAVQSAARSAPELAVRRYTEAYRALAVQAPEFGVWAAMTDAQATRELVRESTVDLAGQLAELRAGRGDPRAEALDAVRSGLGRRYRARLERSILSTADAPAHLVLPTLRQGYVVPHGLVRLAGPADRPATESWWAGADRVPDVQGLLLAHLTGPDATAGPLVVLGQPGSGKSVLTRMLAATLPESDFLVVRVELRTVRADASVQAQIEHALYQMLGEHVSWPELARRAGPALPVVLVDGFDELLQATGVNRADYLEQLREFQQREAELDRPVAVLLTSRTVVADRARCPDGTVVVRLEPFDAEQVGAWLQVWNSLNEAGLRARDLRPLPAAVALAHGELAAQPLLLMLLALYDAGSNELQAAGGGLGRVELYERLFTDFVAREVDKGDDGRGPEQRDAAMEAEWRRLGAVALAMFNRGADVISEAELERDIPYLLPPDEVEPVRSDSVRRALTVGQLLVGRFFFIHESRAVRDTGSAERSFEFLHATFGEYLAARHIVAELVDLAEERVHPRRRRQSTVDAGYLYAATSFATVARRAPLFDFCHGLLARLDADQRRRCRELVLGLLPDAGFAHPTWSLADYQPRRKPVAARHAAFSANLVCFAVLLSDGPVDVVDLVGEPVVTNWRRQALLWHSQLDLEDPQRMWQTFRVAWDLDASPTRLTIRVEDGTDVGLLESLPWPPDERPAVGFGLRPAMLAHDAVLPADSVTGRSLRRSAFVQTAFEVREHLYTLAPYWRNIGDPRQIVRLSDELLSDADLLLRLLLTPARIQLVAARVNLYTLALELRGNPRYRRLVLRQLAEDAAGLPPAELAGLVSTLGPDDAERDAELVAALVAIAAARSPDDPTLRSLATDLLDDDASGGTGFARHLAAAFRRTVLPMPDWLAAPDPTG